MNEATKKGLRVRKSLGSPFHENMIYRKAIELLMTALEPSSLSVEEKAVYDEFMAYNSKVKGMVD